MIAEPGALRGSARAVWRLLMLALFLWAATPAGGRVIRRTLQRALLGVQRQEPGPTISNWNQDHSTTPKVFAAVETVEDVVAVVADQTLYPSPLLPVMSMHSVTDCNVNDEGTIVSLRALDRILGLDTSKGTVKVQAGIKLIVMQDWLASQGYEFAFAPEIGDASVGSLVVSTCKDSSVDGPGYLSALVEEVTYVTGDAKLVTISQASNSSAMYDLTSSYGTMGIVVEVVLKVQPLKYIQTVANFVMIKGSSREAHEEFARTLLQLRNDADNLMVIAAPKDGMAYAEQRKKLADQTKAAEQAQQWASQNVVELLKQVKFGSFKEGALIGFPWNMLLSAAAPIINIWAPAVHHRRQLINHYQPVSASEPRLDFSYFEHTDYSRFVEEYANTLDFVRDYKARTGFQPNALATYFVNRPGGRPSGSNYHDSNPGISFMIDPIFGDPSNQGWKDFQVAFNDFQYKAGAVLSISQTKYAWPSQVVPIPPSIAHPRFTTKFYKQFVR